MGTLTTEVRALADPGRRFGVGPYTRRGNGLLLPDVFLRRGHFVSLVPTNGNIYGAHLPARRVDPAIPKGNPISLAFSTDPDTIPGLVAGPSSQQ
jgi:hypothetical protein